MKWQSYSEDDIEEDEDIIKTAAMVRLHGIKNLDALHLACAIQAKADFFLTTDDGILKKAREIDNILITDPIGFVKEASI